jgi:hypothetical protein
VPCDDEAMARARGLCRLFRALSRVVDDDNADERSELDARCRPQRNRDDRRRSPRDQQCAQLHWRSDTDFDQRWEQRTYNLSHVTDVDLIMSYWAGEAIAHTIVSFGFDDAARLAFSIETRKESQEGYSSIAGFFKQFELAIVAADERDAVRVRSNVRGEDVRIYRLRMSPKNAQILLREYVEEANDLARTPRFYNTVTANCTNLVFEMVRVIHPGVPMDARVFFTGYLPNYAYDLGATDTSVSFEKLRELSKIQDKAAQADADPNFSARIREGVPAPR